MPDNEPDDGANLEVNLGVGYARNLGDRLLLDISMARYMYPGTFAGADYDYNELIGTLWIADRYHATLGYSDDVFGMGAEGIFYGVGADWQLPAELSLTLGYGHYDLDDTYGASYSFSSIGVSRPVGPVSVSLTYHDTFGDAAELFYANSIGSRFVLAVDIGLLH